MGEVDTTTYYFAGGSYEVESDGTTETSIQYYSIGGMSIAMKKGSELNYFLTDHLGSVVGITDGDGALTSETRYTPFGEVREDIGSISETDFGYTYQKVITGSGLMDYKARFYDASIGRFIQPDTLVPGAGSSQGYNRYGYALNNPIKYSDPSGHKACSGSSSGGDCYVDSSWLLNKLGKSTIQKPIAGPSTWISQSPSVPFTVRVQTPTTTSTPTPKNQPPARRETYLSESPDTPVASSVPNPNQTPYPYINNENDIDNVIQAIQVTKPGIDYYLESIRGIKAPFPFNVGPDIIMQLAVDRNMELTIGQRIGRSVIAGSEGILISQYAGANAAVMEAATSESGGVSVVLSGTTYVISSIKATNFADDINALYLFPALGLNPIH